MPTVLINLADGQPVARAAGSGPLRAARKGEALLDLATQEYDPLRRIVRPKYPPRAPSPLERQVADLATRCASLEHQMADLTRRLSARD